jgi:hypothetical protein
MPPVAFTSLPALALSLPLLFFPFVAPRDDAPPAPPAGLASPEATEAFAKAVASFEAGEFDVALASFATAAKGAKEAAKEEIDGYEKACKGAKKLPKIEKGIADRKWRAAWMELEKLAKSHGEGPLALHLAPLRETIEGELFFPLANFEENPPEPEKLVANRRPESASVSTDEKNVREGKASLRWASGQGPGFAGMTFGFLPIAAFDGAKVKDYPILELWLLSTDENFGKFTLYFGIEEGGPPNAFMTTDILKTRCFLHHITVEKPGWKHVRVDLTKEITKNNSVDWGQVTGVALLVIPPSHPKTIYIDGLRLERP